jgi:uncharacterized C2H2 Zn-finger protein
MEEAHSRGWACGQCDTVLKNSKQMRAHLKKHREGAEKWRHLCGEEGCQYGSHELPSLHCHRFNRHAIAPPPNSTAVKCPHCGNYYHSARFLRDFHLVPQMGCVKNQGMEVPKKPQKPKKH